MVSILHKEVETLNITKPQSHAADILILMISTTVWQHLYQHFLQIPALVCRREHCLTSVDVRNMLQGCLPKNMYVGP